MGWIVWHLKCFIFRQSCGLNITSLHVRIAGDVPWHLCLYYCMAWWGSGWILLWFLVKNVSWFFSFKACFYRYNFFFFITTYFVPIVIMVICYVRIYFTLKSNLNVAMESPALNMSIKRKKKVCGFCSVFSNKEVFHIVGCKNDTYNHNNFHLVMASLQSLLFLHFYKS